MIARELQIELKRVGCDAGEVDGAWGDKAKTALSEFARFAKVALPSDEPSSGALQAVRNEKDRVCPSAVASMLARELQIELKRVGCDPGEADGVWGAEAKSALRKFARFAKVGLPSDEPSSGALEAVRSENGRICSSASETRDEPKRKVAHRPRMSENSRRPSTAARQGEWDARPCGFGFWKYGDECRTASGKTCVVTGIHNGKVENRCH
jgi:peptidoglycan hydrolase-like protein with peptidoglycan-binding domain